MVAVLEVSPTDVARKSNNEFAARYFGADIMPLEQAVVTVEGWRKYFVDRLEIEDGDMERARSAD
jgi:hypothetical protein